jgi:hypothetical protein
VIARYYELHVRGDVPRRMETDLETTAWFQRQHETVLTTELIDQQELQVLLVRMVDFGLDVREIHCVPHPWSPATGYVAGGTAQDRSNESRS